MFTFASASRTLTLEISMTDGTIYYTKRWVFTTRKPFPGEEWLSPETARSVYEEVGSLDAVDAHQVDAQGVPIQRWVLGFSTAGGVRASFFTEQGALWRQIDWKSIDGRLWRWITVDYTYPDDTRSWRQDEWIHKVEARVNPDDNGEIISLNPKLPRSEGRKLTRFTGRSFDKYWLDRPAFGDWTSLTDPGPSAYEVAGFDQSVHAV